jgi:ribose transport system ATP-binding protein
MSTHEGHAALAAESPEPEHVALVELRGISKRFPGVQALQDVTLSVAPGEIHAVIGENGAGKSTIMKILAGIHRPEDGEILVRGRPVTIGSPTEAQALGITTIYQERTLAPDLSAIENIFLGRERTREGVLGRGGLLDKRTMRAEIGPLCDEFGFDASDLDRPVEEFGALKQHVVEILKALAFDSALVIMDEPTAALADHEREALFERMRQMRERGVTVLWVTHRLEELIGLADRATVLRDGRYIATVDPQATDTSALIHLMIGRDVASIEDLVEREVAPHAGADSPVEVLRVDGLCRGTVLRDISFTLHRGEILGIGGLAGAGRTELAHAIMGADELDRGTILVDGRPVRIKSPADAVRCGIALVPEERKSQGIIGDFTVAENITASCMKRVLLGPGLIDRRRENRVAGEYVEQMTIRPSSVRQRIRFLSGGNQQKAIIARGLFAGPKVLIFDEPTQGVDVGAKTELYRLIGDFVKNGGAAIVISSELPELCGISDRILVMRQGRLEGEVPGHRRGDSADTRRAIEERVTRLAAAGETDGHQPTELIGSASGV